MSFHNVLTEIQSQISSGLIQGAVVHSNLNEEPIACGIQSGTTPMSADSRFDIASTGKVFTAGCASISFVRLRMQKFTQFKQFYKEIFIHDLSLNNTFRIIMQCLQTIIDSGNEHSYYITARNN